MSNVVQLKTPKSAPKKSKLRSTRRTGSPPAYDAALIRECIAFAQNVAAHDAGFAVDTSENLYAPKLADPFSTRYEAALHKMAKLSATTLEGLQAKARVVPIVILNAAQSPDEREDNFFTSFAADVNKLLEPIIEERRKAVQS